MFQSSDLFGSEVCNLARSLRSRLPTRRFNPQTSVAKSATRALNDRDRAANRFQSSDFGTEVCNRRFTGILLSMLMHVSRDRAISLRHYSKSSQSPPPIEASERLAKRCKLRDEIVATSLDNRRQRHAVRYSGLVDEDLVVFEAACYLDTVLALYA